ncbi:MAG: hypothetical protein QXY05_00400 [Candidatus Anstonellales archaeon]
MTKERLASDEYAKLAAIGLIGLIVGLLIGPMIIPAQPVVENKTEEVFSPNMQKINEIKALFEDYYYLQTGEKITLSYVSTQKLGNLLLIKFQTPDNSPVQVYTTEDYVYLIPNVIKYADLKQSIDAAKSQLEQMEKESQTTQMKSEKPDVKLYIMSFCPYGNVAEQAFNSVIHTLGDTIAFEPVYIIYDETVSPAYSASNTEYCTVDDKNVTYCSMHGMNELRQGIREIAIYKLYGAGTWVDYVDAVDKQCTLQNIEECWKTVAENMNLNPSEIEAYYNEHMYEILADQKEKTFSAGKFGSPSIVINGKDYSGSRTSESFKTAICAAFIAQPENCNATLSETQAAPSGSCG